MTRFLAAAIAAALLAVPAISRAAEFDPTVPGAFASPQPSIDQPRKIVMSLSERDPARVTEVINNVGNVQRYYGADDVEIALVAYGPGIHAVLRADSTVAARIAGLLAVGVRIYACDTTLQTIHQTPADLLPGVRVVPSGLPAIVELETDGWHYVRP